jgi:hypothetical protein
LVAAAAGAGAAKEENEEEKEEEASAWAMATCLQCRLTARARLLMHSLLLHSLRGRSTARLLRCTGSL